MCGSCDRDAHQLASPAGAGTASGYPRSVGFQRISKRCTVRLCVFPKINNLLCTVEPDHTKTAVR